MIIGLVAGTLLTAMPSYGAHARFRRLVVVGDSILAGFGSGGFVTAGPVGQTCSACLRARRAGVRFRSRLQPAGRAAAVRHRRRHGNGQLDPGEVRRTTDSIGSRARPIRVARNLAVPGEDVTSVFDTISPGVIARRLITGEQVDGRDVLKFLVLGVPPRADSVSQVSRAQDLNPTFLMVWLGNNDVLDMATLTNPTAATVDSTQFENRFRRLLDALADTGAGMAVANLRRHRHRGAPPRRERGDGVQADRRHPALGRPALDRSPRSELPVSLCTGVLGPNDGRLRATIISFNAESRRP
jgi:lysophospholipase L1-like esterase